MLYLKIINCDNTFNSNSLLAGFNPLKKWNPGKFQNKSSNYESKETDTLRGFFPLFKNLSTMPSFVYNQTRNASWFFHQKKKTTKNMPVFFITVGLPLKCWISVRNVTFRKSILHRDLKTLTTSNYNSRGFFMYLSKFLHTKQKKWHWQIIYSF